jgi:uncharacterized cysteine cluster protein YcgN (CxxCxxCC family)
MPPEGEGKTEHGRALRRDFDGIGIERAAIVSQSGTGLDREARTGFFCGMDDIPFWKRKTLEEMTRAEWESLCDGCAKCCLVKLEDEDTETIEYTDAACKLLDLGTCRCTDYKKRTKRVPDCVHLTPKVIQEVNWMPPSCAYRLIAEGKDLYWWHPLVSGEADSVVRAGMSVKGRVISETKIDFDDICDRIVNWPKLVAD